MKCIFVKKKQWEKRQIFVYLACIFYACGIDFLYALD